MKTKTIKKGTTKTKPINWSPFLLDVPTDLLR
jgi:hypothetical protein